MQNKELIDEYRLQVRGFMLEAVKDNGEKCLTEREVDEILDTFSDDDLAFGMDFNTPQETALMLVEQ